jgi:hypothetical protein
MQAFSHCPSLETLILPDSATEWTGSGAISLAGNNNYAGLKKLVIPAGMTTITENAFRAFRPVTFTFEVKPGNTKYSAVLDGKALVSTVEGVKTLLACPSASGEVIIPAGISVIDPNAFGGTSAAYAASMTGIVIPDSVTSLPDKAFSYCRELQSVTFGSGLTAIPTDCFARCPKLGSIAIPGNIKTIGQTAFQNSGGGGFTVILEEGVETIANSAFNCSLVINSGPSSITIPASLISIGATAFSYSNLTAITIPASVSSIGSGAFSNCKKLISVDMSQSTLTAIPASIFSNCSALTTALLPPALEEIGNNAFTTCTALAQINLPATLTTLGTTVFQSSGLSSVTLPASVASIPSNAFTRCGYLVWVKILKDDGLVAIPNSFPIQKSSGYPLIYVPDNLFTQYAGDATTEPMTESQWTNAPKAVWECILPLSEFEE